MTSCCIHSVHRRRRCGHFVGCITLLTYLWKSPSNADGRPGYAARVLTPCQVRAHGSSGAALTHPPDEPPTPPPSSAASRRDGAGRRTARAPVVAGRRLRSGCRGEYGVPESQPCPTPRENPPRSPSAPVSPSQQPRPPISQNSDVRQERSSTTTPTPSPLRANPAAPGHRHADGPSPSTTAASYSPPTTTSPPPDLSSPGSAGVLRWRRHEGKCAMSATDDENASTNENNDGTIGATT